MPNKSFFVWNHQGKADSYVDALRARGWIPTKDPSSARFVLSDFDVTIRRKTLDDLRKKGVKVFLYNHAARPNIWYDFPEQDFNSRVDAQFVPTEGQGAVMRAYGFPYPIESVGWHLCEIRPFRPRDDLRKILFAPIHPNSNNFLCKLDRDLNRSVFERILKVSSVCNVEIMVRYIGDLKSIGLWKAGGIQYMEGRKDGSTKEIDEADLVVSHQTFAFLAVARGVPTLMMGEEHAPRWGGSEEALKTVRSWEKYKGLMRYPLDILESSDTVGLMCSAARSDEAIRDWRARMIGEPFDPVRFVSRLESYL